MTNEEILEDAISADIAYLSEGMLLSPVSENTDITKNLTKFAELTKAHATQWQPIETAPKQDILLLACAFDNKDDWRIKCGGYWDEKWNIFGGSWQPTHWQHLPLPPNAQQERN